MVCGSPSAIAGDGSRSACWPCIYRIGHKVNHPECVSDGELVLLLEAHGDVVEFARESRGAKGQNVTEKWRWIAPDPEV